MELPILRTRKNIRQVAACQRLETESLWAKRRFLRARGKGSSGWIWIGIREKDCKRVKAGTQYQKANNRGKNKWTRQMSSSKQEEATTASKRTAMIGYKVLQDCQEIQEIQEIQGVCHGGLVPRTTMPDQRSLDSLMLPECRRAGASRRYRQPAYRASSQQAHSLDSLDGCRLIELHELIAVHTSTQVSFKSP